MAYIFSTNNHHYYIGCNLNHYYNHAKTQKEKSCKWKNKELDSYNIYRFDILEILEVIRKI